MSADYKPGTVAMVSAVGTDPEVRLLQHPRSGGGEGKWMGAKGFVYDDHFVSDVRPLVVLDLSAGEVVEYLDAFDACSTWQRNVPTQRQKDLVRQVRNQIEAQTRPPKPSEPQGLGAVVEDASGERWMRIAGHEAGCNDWRLHRADDVVGSRTYYIDIDVVRVLSDGWEPKP